MFFSDRQMLVCLWDEQRHWDVELSMLWKSRWVTYHQKFGITEECSCTSTTLALAEFYTREQIHPQTVAGLLIPFFSAIHLWLLRSLVVFFLQWQDLTFSWRRSLVQSKLPSSNVNLEWLGGFKADFREPLRQGDASPYPAKYPKNFATFKKSKSQTVSINVYVDFQPF